MRADLKVFHNTIYTVMTETQDQAIQKFNQATSGGLVLTSSTINKGDFDGEVSWAKIANLVRRRNAYADTALTAVQLAQLVSYSVKVAAGTPPVVIDPGMLKWIKASQAEAGAVIGKQLAEDNLADMLNTGIAAYVAAVGQNTKMMLDVSALTSGHKYMTLQNLNSGAALFGDRSQDIRCWLMHSKSLYDIYSTALDNTNQLFSFGTVKVMSDGFGRPLVITDSPNLMVAAGSDPSTDPAKYFTLGLNNGAVIVEQNNDEFTDNTETKNGNENIQATYQAEWTYNLGIRGHTWDITSGGKSPTTAALATGTNWDKTCTYDKDGPGILIKSL
ncbi:major capsid protein [Buttiauxella sp. S04-F03]|uniref:major capsid protein n=1 Tax=Buttiauxella sp. W03-F01 TaxID=2904524 RepID=UPI001E367692|nr:major capsid protein [Buttiauxella sp. W03-F01]MCE0801989.1 major capsid protein [Buttiauxella sp. W03-F01]